MIGVGGRGQASWSQVPVESLVAMCDVDDRMSQEAKKAVPNAKWYKDFRKMFDEMANDIDAVMIATPDRYTLSRSNGSNGTGETCIC